MGINLYLLSSVISLRKQERPSILVSKAQSEQKIAKISRKNEFKTGFIFQDIYRIDIAVPEIIIFRNKFDIWRKLEK